MLRRGLVAVVAWFALAGSLHAQSVVLCEVNCTVTAGTPVTVYTELQPGIAIYRLFVNESLGPVVARWTETTVEFPFGSGFPHGFYRFFVTCMDANGVEVVCTDTNTLTVEPAPAPEPAGCLTGKTLAPIGSLLNWTGKHGDADPFIAAREAEGWVLVPGSRKKMRNFTTLQMECQG